MAAQQAVEVVVVGCQAVGVVGGRQAVEVVVGCQAVEVVAGCQAVEVVAGCQASCTGTLASAAKIRRRSQPVLKALQLDPKPER